MTRRILKHNTLVCGAGEYRIVAEDDGCEPYLRLLRQGSVLEHTRSFVVWLEETPAGPDEYGRPQPGRYERTEVARGLA